MTLTGAVIGAALRAVGAGSRLVQPLDQLAAGAAGALRQTPPGLTAAGAASFLATCAQESDYFRTTVEYGTGQRYAPYIGRGFVQCTWRDNYAAFGAWCKARGLVADADVFVRDPASLGELRWAWLTAVWYFEATRLWEWANAGDHMRVSQAVNGGRGRAGTAFVPHGWTQRLAMFRAFSAAGDDLLPAGGEEDDMPLTDDDVRRVADAVLGALLPDFYTADEADHMSVATSIAWGTRHAAVAIDQAGAANAAANTAAAEARAARAEVSALAAEVRALRAGGVVLGGATPSAGLPAEVTFTGTARLGGQ